MLTNIHCTFNKTYSYISRMLQKMDLDQIGRNYYNKNKKTEFNEYRYVWSGLWSAEFHIL